MLERNHLIRKMLLIALFATMVVSESSNNFVQRLLKEDPGQNMRKINFQEYYGEIDWVTKYDIEQDEQNIKSKAFFVMLLSYDYATQTIRMHFNMKEPYLKGNTFLRETNMQWNTFIDMNEDVDRKLIQYDEGEIEMNRFITVYGFTKEMLVHRETCYFNITLYEKQGLVHIKMEADPLNGEQCLHRDEMQDIPLQFEDDEKTHFRDYVFFSNMEALEHTLTLSSFKEGQTRGNWIVGTDDFVISDSKFRDFFQLDHNESGQKTNATILFKIKDYDLVGPYSHHEYRKNCSPHNLKTCISKPWLQIQITFSNMHYGVLEVNKETGELRLDEGTNLQYSEVILELQYPLSQTHLLINKQKRSFRAQNPDAASAMIPTLQGKHECEDLTFSFQVRNENTIKYILEDLADGCFPFQVEGTLNLNLTSEEVIEEKIEQEVISEIEHMTDAEKKDVISENEALIKDVESKAQELTEQQMDVLEKVFKDFDSGFEEIRQKQADRFSENYIEHDYDAKLAEQSDWYSRDMDKRKEWHEKNKERKNRKSWKKEKLELTGAFYAIFALALGFCVYQYYNSKRQQRQQNPQYVHVMPEVPAFA